MTDERSSRTSLIIGECGVGRLKNSQVVVAGAGAVGGYVIEGLIRAGIGRIKIIDGDVVSESNINRQILATYDTIGRPKAELAAERAVKISPGISADPCCNLITKDSDFVNLIGHPDVLVDAIDTVENKAALLRYASENGIMTFSSMGAALRMDTTKIFIAPLKKTKVCPLAAAIRSKLRDCDTSKINCVYSEEVSLTVPNERDNHGKSVLGSLPTIPAIFGMTLANETIRFLISEDVCANHI